jgi:hypothetical protein
MAIETTKTASNLASRNEPSGLPGLVAGGVASLATTLLLWAWVLPQLGQPPALQSGSALAMLTEVAPEEIDAASAMLGASPALLARLRQEDRKCGAHLAVVTAVHMPGQKPVSLRVKSGHWFSPLYKLSDVPVRIALPFPAHYAEGHGTLIIIREGGDAVVSLSPAWRLAGAEGPETREVSWIPDRACPTGTTP